MLHCIIFPKPKLSFAHRPWRSRRRPDAGRWDPQQTSSTDERTAEGMYQCVRAYTYIHIYIYLHTLCTYIYMYAHICKKNTTYIFFPHINVYTHMYSSTYIYRQQYRLCAPYNFLEWSQPLVGSTGCGPGAKIAGRCETTCDNMGPKDRVKIRLLQATCLEPFKQNVGSLCLCGCLGPSATHHLMRCHRRAWASAPRTME